LHFILPLIFDLYRNSESMVLIFMVNHEAKQSQLDNARLKTAQSQENRKAHAVSGEYGRRIDDHRISFVPCNMTRP